MSITFLLAGVGPMTVGALLLFLLWRSLAGVRQVLRWRPSPVRTAAPGPASFSGVLKAAWTPLESNAVRACLLRRSRFRARCRQKTTQPNKVTVSDTSRWFGDEKIETVDALIDDGTGQPLPVDLRGAGLVDGGEALVQSWTYQAFIKLYPDQKELVPAEAESVELYESLLPDGERVLLHGTVCEVEAHAGEPEQGTSYRQPPARVLRVGNSEATPLVVVPGGRGAVISIALLPALVVLAVSLALIAMGVMVLQAGMLWAALER